MLYDNILCRHTLPLPVNDRAFCTKDTPRQFCENYEIREDGSLWYQEYELGQPPEEEDHNPEVIYRVNLRWVPYPYTGVIRFGTSYTVNPRTGWIQFYAEFDNGRLVHPIVLEAWEIEEPNPA